MEAAVASEARRFGKYTLVAKLATGGMAEIFLARLHGDGGFEKLVCIKRILPHLAKDPQFVAMFLDEARVAARISHPNVCQVFELGELDGQYYIAMEYLEGVPLAVFRRKEFYPAPPDPRLVAGFGVQACEGLHHAHQLKRGDGELLGVVHRDITPQNLFATTDGVVKVLDFGIAKVHDATVRTSTGAVKGTYAYMAPEQLRNERLDRRTDVWAIGAVLWETLAQTHLFKRDTEFLTFEAITKLPIPNICEVRADVPPLLGDTLSRALSRNPDDRFPSARALGEALAQAVGPLGGIMTSPGISDEVSDSFQAALAEQRTLLRIAREGGQFDLESSSPLVGHGTRVTTTPVSNIQRRAREAQEEVANFVAAQHAIDSLTETDAEPRARRFESDGAFTPAPSRNAEVRRSRSQQAVDAILDELPEAQPERRSSPYAVAPAAWRNDETPAPAPFAAVRPAAPSRPSRLPWIIAALSVIAAATTGVLLYTKLSEKREQATAAAGPPEAAPVVMREAPTAGSAEPLPPPVETTVEKVEAVVPVAEATPPPEPAATAEEPAQAEVASVEPETPPTRTVGTKRGAGTKIETRRNERKDDDRNDRKNEDRNERKTPSKLGTIEPVKAVAGRPGMITIDSAPVYAVIYIDGKKLGETPLVNIKLAPGKHAVRAVSPSGATKHLTITIEAGKTAPVRKISW